jgi:hypothetical protein
MIPLTIQIIYGLVKKELRIIQSLQIITNLIYQKKSMILVKIQIKVKY